MMTTAPVSSLLAETAGFLEQYGFHDADIGMILGTGFGRFVEDMQDAHALSYARIPHFPVSTVPDHAGNLVCGRVGRARVLAMQGRVHRYEGYSPAQVTFPVRVMRHLGVSTLIVTNAAGGLNPFFMTGDLMLIEDHINMIAGPVLENPDEQRTATPPCYAESLNRIVLEAAMTLRMPLRRGILAAMLGPSFETPAEIAMLRQIGADAVTMSTIPEVTLACALGMSVMGLSCISNMCVGEVETVRHEEAVAVVNAAGDRFSTLMRSVIPAIAR